MRCNFSEKFTNSHKIGLGCSTSLIESKRTPFLKIGTCWPYRDSCESCLASKNNLFFAFLWSRMCTTLLLECLSLVWYLSLNMHKTGNMLSYVGYFSISKACHNAHFKSVYSAVAEICVRIDYFGVRIKISKSDVEETNWYFL